MKKLKPGTRFVGNKNHVEMELLDVKDNCAIIEFTKTGNTCLYGYSALQHCDITIIGGNE